MGVFRSFFGPDGGDECYQSLEGEKHLDFSAQLRSIIGRCAEAQREAKLDATTTVFRRVFLSDVLNQAANVRSDSEFGPRRRHSDARRPPAEDVR